MKFSNRLALFVLFCILTSFASVYTGVKEINTQPSPTPRIEGATTGFEVVSIVDGDTFKVKENGLTKTVRIVGIDTPETVDPRRPVQCMGKEASAALKQLIFGKFVQLHPDSTQSNTDRYGRLLRFVFLSDGTDVGKYLIQNGFAQSSLYSRIPHIYYQQYEQTEEIARHNQLGLWNQSLCPAISPDIE